MLHITHTCSLYTQKKARSDKQKMKIRQVYRSGSSRERKSLSVCPSGQKVQRGAASKWSKDVDFCNQTSDFSRAFRHKESRQRGEVGRILQVQSNEQIIRQHLFGMRSSVLAF